MNKDLSNTQIEGLEELFDKKLLSELKITLHELVVRDLVPKLVASGLMPKDCLRNKLVTSNDIPEEYHRDYIFNWFMDRVRATHSRLWVSVGDRAKDHRAALKKALKALKRASEALKDLKEESHDNFVALSDRTSFRINHLILKPESQQTYRPVMIKVDEIARFIEDECSSMIEDQDNAYGSSRYVQAIHELKECWEMSLYFDKYKTSPESSFCTFVSILLNIQMRVVVNHVSSILPKS